MVLSLALVFPAVAAAQGGDDLKALRQEFESLKAGIGAVQRLGLPVFTPEPPLVGAPDAELETTPLYAGEKLDVIRANSATYSLNRVEIADVAPPGVRTEVTGLDKPTTVVAATFDGLTYTLKLGKLRGDDYYATLWISGEPKAAGADAAERAKSIAARLPAERALAGHILLISRSKFEDILKKRAELLEKKDTAKK